MNDQAEAVNLLSAIANIQNAEEYKELNWEGSFDDYLRLVQETPRVTRNAFQRIYDMILSHGVEEVVEHKKKYSRYRFFRDERHHGRDAVYGIDQNLNHLVDIFKSAARNYGTERRVILLLGVFHRPHALRRHARERTAQGRHCRGDGDHGSD